MSTETIEKPVSAPRFANSIDYWRRRRGFTWKTLAAAIPSEYAPLYRTARSFTGRKSEGGKLSGAKIERLAAVLEVEIWQLHVAAGEAEKMFGKIPE